MSYRYGDASLPTVVLLNGSLFHQGQWALFRSTGLSTLLRGKCAFVTFDFGGTGESSGQGIPWHIDRLGLETKAVVETVARAPVHLFGVSKGTIASQSFCAGNPQLVKSHAGYGWFHLGYSKIDFVRSFFEKRLKSFAFLERYSYTPLTRKDFNEIWRTTYREVLGGTTHSNPLIAAAVTAIIKPLVFKIARPTSLRTMYDWFQYGVEAMHEGQEWFAQRQVALSQVPTLVMHARRDGTLPYGMAEELSVALAHSSLLTYEGGFNHVSPLVMPFQARTIAKDYVSFLEKHL